jgi:RHS repeat-associated protein
LTNSNGTVTDEYEYDAYGNSFTKSGTTPNNYLYRGEQYDSDLGLYYLRARYYNAGTGRFLSRDPYDGDAKIPATLHKYLYAGGDPVNASDPSGRDFVDWIYETGMAVVAAKVTRVLVCRFVVGYVVYEIMHELALFNNAAGAGAGAAAGGACAYLP